MLSKCVFVLLLIAIESTLICGKFFRKDYKYIEHQKSFYKINTWKKTWSQAQISCLREGATLFYPKDKKEAKAVMELWNMNQPEINEIFIGVANWNVPEIYETVDGKRLSDVYHNWAVGEPNSCGNESCLIMEDDGVLRDESCDSVFPFICKKTLDTLQWNAECNLPDLDYKYNKEMDRCYKFHLDPQNWTDAFLICDAEESYLAIINSVEEDRLFINITAEADKDSIGGNYLRGAVHLGFQNRSGIWETIKGVPLEQSGFVGWGNTQPDGEGKETCGSMFYTGELNDIGCWQRMFFICEHEIPRHPKDVHKPRVYFPSVMKN